MRWTARLALLAAFLSLVACSSGDKPTPQIPATPVVIRNPDAIATIIVAVGDDIDFRLAPQPGVHRPNGQPVNWPTPYTDDTAVLHPSHPETCPNHDTCQNFKAIASGTTKVYSVGPSGVICDNQGCAGIQAALPHPIQVNVVAVGTPKVIYR